MRTPPVLPAMNRVTNELAGVGALVRAGMVGFEPPHRLAAGLLGVRRYGLLGGMLVLSAARYADRDVLIDERGSLTFRELNERANALANTWREAGLKPGDGVAILVRNHRGFHDALFAASKCGARIILLNTDFAGRQVREVCEREGTDLLVHDDEYTATLADFEPRAGRWRAWTDLPGEDTIEAAIEAGDRREPPAPGVEPKIIILTSGTTGTPKGARRSEPASLVPIAGLFGKVPFRAKEVTECCAPLFHALGLAQSMLAVALGSTLVVRRYFDPAATLESLATHRASMLVVVPVMMQRILELGEEAREGLDLSNLRIIFVAGSQLGADLATRITEAFGPVIYNLYGSTEVAYATIATPEDLAVEPSCVGGVARGVTVRILDDEGKEVPTGVTGRIFVASQIQFEGYTGGGSKEVIDGLMSSGDVGHFDEAGRLFVDGRDDDMVVCGGENVFPAEVEELIAEHADVVEAVAIGVPDEKFGTRLRAYVVRREGAGLDEETVRDYVRANLARYKVPRDVVFLDELPRNPTGKILKRQLPDRAN